MPPRIIVYGSACPACTQAKAVLDRHGVAFDEQPMSAFPPRHGRVTTMPQITIDDELLGGINSLLKLARSGGLHRIATDDERPWIRVKRRLGHGYDVIVLDRLGREILRRHAKTNGEAAGIVDELHTR
jgi:glutaredoxin 3